MTPAEQAQKDVEEWIAAQDIGPLRAECDGDQIDNQDVADLIARLTPVYERAQEYEHLDKARMCATCGGAICAPMQCARCIEAEKPVASMPARPVTAALRERAERAEAKLADATAYCSGEWPCEASTAAASLERERNDAEADVARMRKEVTARLADAGRHIEASIYERDDVQVYLGFIEEALAATEPRR